MIVRPSKRKISLWGLVLGALIATSLSAEAADVASSESEKKTESTKPKSRFAAARNFVKGKAADLKKKVTETALDVGCTVCTSPKAFLAKNDTILSKALEQCVRKCPEGMNTFLEGLKKKQADKEKDQRNAQDNLGIAFSEHLKIYNESVDNKKDKEKKKDVRLSNSRQKELKQKIETLDKEISELRRQISKIEGAKEKVLNNIVEELNAKVDPQLVEGKEDENLKPEIQSEIERLAKLASAINGTEEEGEEPTSQKEPTGEESRKEESKAETDTSPSPALEGASESKGKGSLLTAPLPSPLAKELLTPGKPPVPLLPPLPE